MGLFEALLETLCPTRCSGCEFPGRLLCDTCREALPMPAPAHVCPRCAAPYGLITCTECWDTEFAFSAALAVGVLERPLSRCITLYKDAGERRMGEVLGELLATTLAPWATWADALAPIPAAAKALRRRGFDHAALVAQSAAAHMGVACLELLEPGRAADQRGLGRESRRANLAGRVRVREDVRVPPRVLLVDDVLTTGATLDAAASALLSAGAQEVRVGVLARAW